MATSLSELLAQKAELDRAIKQAQSAARVEAIARIQQLIAENGLTMADISAAPTRKSGALSGKTVAPKYRDPATGATWTGRGLKPKWLSSALANGKAIADFTI